MVATTGIVSESDVTGFDRVDEDLEACAARYAEDWQRAVTSRASSTPAAQPAAHFVELLKRLVGDFHLALFALVVDRDGETELRRKRCL